MAIVTRDFLELLIQEIQSVYLSIKRPWVVAFSGGKDSTTVLQLLWKAIAQLPPERRSYPVFVIAGDTRVEDPAMSMRVTRSIERINIAARGHGLPFSAHIVSPAPHQGYWCLLLGKGYPAPSSRFRWCTDRLKVKPSNAFILERVAQFGEVVLVLGVREQESMSRAQTMETYQVPGQLLRRHSTLRNASVYAPIATWTTSDVWTYLLAVASPWGDDNRNLRAIYQQSDGECPLVIDHSTPSCGNSRFGCWTCTVVRKNTSLETRYELDEQEAWLLPLIEYRNLLKSTRESGQKVQFCEIEGKNDNRVNLTLKGDTIATRLYTLPTRQMLLRRLLEAQEQARELGPDPQLELITAEELRLISRIHRFEEGDWGNTVAKIYREVTGRDDIEWLADDIGAPDDEDLEALLCESCDVEEVPLKLAKQLLQVCWSGQGMNHRATVLPRIEALFKKDWRPLEDKIAAAYAQKLDEKGGGEPLEQAPLGQLALFD